MERHRDEKEDQKDREIREMGSAEGGRGELRGRDKYKNRGNKERGENREIAQGRQQEKRKTR